MKSFSWLSLPNSLHLLFAAEKWASPVLPATATQPPLLSHAVYLNRGVREAIKSVFLLDIVKKGH